MTIPNLVHPIPIEIQQINRAATIVDEDFDEEVENVARVATKTCPGQVRWKTFNKGSYSGQGVDLKADGYITFRPIDLRAVGIAQLKYGDKIVGIGAGANKMVVNVFVVYLEPLAHYPELQGPGLVRAYFRDRNAVKAESQGMS